MRATSVWPRRLGITSCSLIQTILSSSMLARGCCVWQPIPTLTSSFGDWRVTPGPDRPDHYASLEEGKAYPTKDFILTALKAGEWYPCACFMFCKLSLFKENGLRFAVGLLHEDMEMQPRVFLAADTVVCLKYKFYNYIQRPGSIMKSQNSSETCGFHVRDPRALEDSI